MLSPAVFVVLNVGGGIDEVFGVEVLRIRGFWSDPDIESERAGSGPKSFSNQILTTDQS